MQVLQSLTKRVCKIRWTHETMNNCSGRTFSRHAIKTFFYIHSYHHMIKLAITSICFIKLQSSVSRHWSM
eukprot:c56957_g1_i1 orf=22-231(+)